MAKVVRERRSVNRAECNQVTARADGSVSHSAITSSERLSYRSANYSLIVTVQDYLPSTPNAESIGAG